MASNNKNHLNGEKVMKNQCKGAQPGRVPIYCFKQFKDGSYVWICPNPLDDVLITSYQQKLTMGSFEQLKIVYVKKSFFNDLNNWC